MVLGARRVSNLENAHPALLTSLRGKSMGFRLRSSIRDPTRPRRARAARTTKQFAETAKGKSKSKESAKTLEFDITSVAAPPENTDVEMADAEPLPPARTTTRYRIPRELRRPTLPEISAETLLSFEPELGEGDTLPDLDYIRDAVEECGPGLLRTALAITTDAPKAALPAQLDIKLTDTSSDYPPPTHMLAIYPHLPKHASNHVRRVTLNPIHSVVLALHCSRLPPFSVRGATPKYTSADGTQVSIPVQPLLLPVPSSFAPLCTFLYTKRADNLLKSLLPNTPPPPPTLDTDAAQRRAFAARLAATYTAQALMERAMRVNGLWQNACVLGVAVDELWDTIEVAWEVLVTALAFSTGTEHVVLEPQPPTVTVTSPAASTPTVGTPTPEPDAVAPSSAS